MTKQDDRDERRRKIWDNALKPVYAAISVALTVAAWNHAIPHVFGVPSISWSQALALHWLVLALSTFIKFGVKQ